MARCDSYAYGYCTWGACELADWLPEGWGDAKDWAFHALQDGFAVVQEATLGAIVVYGDNPAYSPLGHVGVVTQVYADGSFQVQEMNAVGWNQYDSRHSSLFDVLGFILPPGVAIGTGAPPPGSGVGQDWNAVQAAWGNLAQMINSIFPGFLDTLAKFKADFDSI